MSWLKRIGEALKPEPEWKKRARSSQGCSVILKGSNLVVTSRGYRMLGGPGTIANPMFKLDRTDPPARIGDAILESLAATHLPLESRELALKERYRLIGVRSEAQL